MNNCRKITNYGLIAVINNCGGNLKNLFIRSCCNISDISVFQLAKVCLKIAIFDAKGCKKITDVSISELLANCQLPCCFTLDDTLITGNCLIKAAENCRGVDINISTGCAAIRNVARCASKIRGRFSGDIFSFQSKSLNCSILAIETIAHRSPNMQFLSLRGCNDLTNEILISITLCCPLLVTLILQSNDNLTAECLVEVVQNCAHLTSFSVSMTDFLDDVLIEIVTNKPQLTYLSVTQCFELSDISILKVAECCAVLRTLLLSDLFNVNVTDVSIIVLIQKCPLLENLCLEGCELLTDSVLIEISQCAYNLTSLNIKECCLITQPAINQLRTSLGSDLLDFQYDVEGVEEEEEE
jgi:hypothetical protein